MWVKEQAWLLVAKVALSGSGGLGLGVKEVPSPLVDVKFLAPFEP